MQIKLCYNSGMIPRIPFRWIEPAFCAGLLDDPVLYLYVRPLGRAIMFDCGQVHHLAKRVLKSVDALFISHPHMDHFMGVDTFVRHVHVSPRTVEIYGPPGIAERTGCKLRGYEWNLSEDYWCNLWVREVHRGGLSDYLLRGEESFACRFDGDTPLPGRTIYENPWLRVEAEICDHKIPCLAFRISEQPSFLVDEEKLLRLGLEKGDWLRRLKKGFYTGGLDGGIDVPLIGGGMRHIPSAAVLYEEITKEIVPSSIGYVTDVGFTEGNIARIVSLTKGVTLLVCECSFLAGDSGKARASHHLCTDDLNHLADLIRPRFLLPMHLSKSYTGNSHLLYQEIEPPPGTTLLRIPEHMTPRPLMAHEFPRPEAV